VTVTVRTYMYTHWFYNMSYAIAMGQIIKR